MSCSTNFQPLDYCCSQGDKNPTREERLKAYEFAREWLNDNLESNHAGICQLLQMATENKEYTISQFTEFIRYKPKHKTLHSYWFSSAKERIEVLTKIINKMKDEKRIPIEIPSDCEVKFDEENNVLIISKKKEEVYIPDSVDEIEGRECPANLILVSSVKRAYAIMALADLVEMRDASNGGWRADWTNPSQKKWIIIFDNKNMASVIYRNYYSATLSFKSEEIAKAFLNKHRELILTAKELL